LTALVVISTRAGSTRLPMKPLRRIAGYTLLQRCIAAARRSLAGLDGVELIVATDHRDIAAHAEAEGCPAVMTPSELTSGSSRALAAAERRATAPDWVVNYQGDAPFQPPAALAGVVTALRTGTAEVATPVVRLDWAALDALRAHKRGSPSSGTTCVRAADGRALWFSKAVLPAIRDEAAARAADPLSPVWRHVGLYGYRLAALRRFHAAPATALETLEGLEQLRLLELGMTIATVPVAPAGFDLSGIDTPSDIERAEALIAAHGDPHEGRCAGW
jgi:3-deoxy-manno-octulosonate cytidylyltransferase (CMP-KDO synthetase)